jgi:glycosyltransferase involved in cell wall biosynthesis
VLIGVDARSLLQPEVRGEGNTLLRLYQELKAIRPAWRAYLYGEKACSDYIASQFEIRRRSVPGFRWNSWERLALPALAWRDGVDLLHCSSSSAPPLVGRPFIVTVHDIIPLVIDDGQTAQQSQRFERSLRSALRRASAVIAVSESTKRDLTSFFGISRDRIDVIHWGTDVWPHPPAMADRDSNLVLAFGGGARRKNTRVVLIAFAEASKLVPSSRLVLVGLSGAKERLEFMQLADDLRITDRVEFTGYIDQKALTALYGRAAVLLYPSLYEGFGMPIVEAMAAGLPVIASARTSIPEVVDGAGELVTPDDHAAVGNALARVLMHAPLREDLATRGIARARQLTWERTAMLTAAVFERVMGVHHR